MRRGVPWCIAGPDYFGPVADDFNYHYAKIAPPWPGPFGPVLRPLDWERFGDIEYNVDFNRPLRVAHSIAMVLYNGLRNRQIIMALHRSPDSPPYNERETLIAEAVGSLFAPIYSLWSLAEPMLPGPAFIWPDGIAPSATAAYERLSHREREVSALLCRRLTLSQIAELLNVSPRTVESHASHVYAKMNVKCRLELVHTLLFPADAPAESSER
jgi:DNA-binding CsgD family transcriptional regulator